MDSPIDLWKDTVDIAETTPIDFECRDRSANVYDPRGVYRTVGEELADEIDATRSIAWDFALRVYLGWLCDERDDIPNLRSAVNQTRLVPPKGWVNANTDDLPTFYPTIVNEQYDDPSDRQFSFQTTETIYDMVGELVDDYSEWGNRDAVFKAAMDFVANEYDEDSKPLAEQTTTDD